MPSVALHRRAFVASGIGGLLLAACATTGGWTRPPPPPQHPPLRPVVGMNKQDVSTTLQPWVTAGNVVWYSAETLQSYADFGSVPNLARCRLQSPLPEWPAGATDWKGFPTSTTIRVVMSEYVPVPDFRGMRVGDARIRAGNAGLSLKFYMADETTEILAPGESLLVQSNVTKNPAGSKIDVGGTVGLVIVGYLLQAGGEAGDDGGGG